MKRLLLTILPLFWPKMPPLGLGFLQSYLSKKNIKADILDLNNIFFNLSDKNLRKQWLISCNTYLERNILKIIKRNHPHLYNNYIEQILTYDIVGFSCYKSNLPTTLEVIKEVKTKRGNIKIVLGGPEIARLYFKGKGKFGNKIDELVDLFVIGEGEDSLTNYLNGLIKNRVVEFKQLKNLNSLPFPRYQDINIDDYPRKNALALQLSRGCIRRCTFCSERLLYQGLRLRPVSSIIDEIKYHRRYNKINNFVFFDSMINAHPLALERLCDQIIANFGSINWEAQIAVREDMKNRVFKKMKQSGCYNLFVGLESGSDTTLKRMNKGFNTKEASNFFKRMKSADLFFGISMITGFPKETAAEFKESLKFVIDNKEIIPKIEQVNPFTYYEGTDTDKRYSYQRNKESSERMNIFIREIKRHNFKYTNAFLGNLVEK